MYCFMDMSERMDMDMVDMVECGVWGGMGLVMVFDGR